MRSIEEIRKLLGAITPGQWRHRKLPIDPAGFVEAPGKPYGVEILGDERYPTKEADAEFIAAAPDIVREILAKLEEKELGYAALKVQVEGADVIAPAPGEESTPPATCSTEQWADCGCVAPDRRGVDNGAQGG